MRKLKETSGKVNSAAKTEFCHGSVCVGNQVPTNCICPTTKK